MGQMRNVYKILFGKPGEKRSVERTRRRWDDNIGMDIREMCCEGVNWMHLAQNNDQRGVGGVFL
jgi:hypothetical protein